MVAHVFNSRVIEIIMMTCPEASMSIESPVSGGVFLFVKS